MMATLLATEALLGRDRFCRKYSNAYRKGKLELRNSIKDSYILYCAA